MKLYNRGANLGSLPIRLASMGFLLTSKMELIPPPLELVGIWGDICKVLVEIKWDSCRRARRRIRGLSSQKARSSRNFIIPNSKKIVCNVPQPPLLQLNSF